jgi:hypothetical protein
MIDHEQRIGAALRAVGDDVHTRPTLAADVRAGAVRRRHRRRVAGVAAGSVAVAVAASVIAAGGLRSIAGPDNPVGTPEPSPSASAAPAPPPALRTCQLERLSIPGGEPASIVTGGDPTGRYLVGRAYGSTTAHVDKHPLLIWDNGRPTTVNMPGIDESFEDINGSGVAVGYSFNGGELRDGWSGYVYRDGHLTKLRAPTRFVNPHAVGENGTIVGSLRNGVDDPDLPLVWRDPATPQRLDLPDGFASGAAVDVATDGTIVGLVRRTAVGDPQGYLWKADGTGQLLPMPEIDGKPTQGWSPDSVHNGVVVGSAVVRNDIGLRNHRLLFDLRTGKFTMLTHAYGDAGNSMGWLLVAADPPFVATPSGRAALPILAPAGGRGVFISEDGLVVGGQANDAGGHLQAVRWRCT